MSRPSFTFRRPERLGLVAGLLLLTATSLSAQSAAQPLLPLPEDALGPGLFRLHGADPALPLDDLAPLARVVGNARFVGVGEAVHTSGGFYQMKHRIFRYLVEEMGFRVLAFESPWLWGEQVEAYVQTCAGSPDTALEGLFTVYRSTELRDLVTWMCQWNTEHPTDRVHFFNFDIQRLARPSGEALVAFLDRLEIAADDPRVTGIQACDGVVETFWPAVPFPAARYQQCRDALAAVAGYFDAHERVIRRQTSREDLAWARIHLVTEASWQEMIYFVGSDFPRAYAAREEGMAYVFQAIQELRYPHERVMLWAHNGHVVRDGFPFVELPSLGGLLSEDLGRRAYVPIALASRDLAADWPAQQYCGVLEGFLGENPVEDVLHEVAEEALFLDLRPGHHRPYLDPNERYSLGNSYPVSLPDHFDALIYLHASPAMHPLAWPACQ